MATYPPECAVSVTWPSAGRVTTPARYSAISTSSRSAAVPAGSASLPKSPDAAFTGPCGTIMIAFAPLA